MEIRNAIVQSVSIDDADRGLLTAWLFLDYGGSSQGFGGYALYLPKSFDHHTIKGDYAGHFIYRCMEIAGVTKWSDIKGKTVRVKCEHSKIHAIGHIIKDDWFNPTEELEKIKIIES